MPTVPGVGATEGITSYDCGPTETLIHVLTSTTGGQVAASSSAGPSPISLTLPVSHLCTLQRVLLPQETGKFSSHIPSYETQISQENPDFFVTRIHPSQSFRSNTYQQVPIPAQISSPPPPQQALLIPAPQGPQAPRTAPLAHTSAQAP